MLCSKLGPRLKVIAVIDPAVERAQKVIQSKCDSFVVSAYQDTRLFATFDDFLAAYPSSSSPNTPTTPNGAPNGRHDHMPKPHAFLVGSPPMFRGSTAKGRNLEMMILKHFPGVPMFVEKPVATGPETELGDLRAVAQNLRETNVVCSVGYVLLLL